MHLHRSGSVLGLHRTGVGTVICHVHVLDLQAVLSPVCCRDGNSRVHRPFVTASKNNARAVQPRAFGSSIFQVTPGGKRETVGVKTQTSWIPLTCYRFLDCQQLHRLRVEPQNIRGIRWFTNRCKTTSTWKQSTVPWNLFRTLVAWYWHK